MRRFYEKLTSLDTLLALVSGLFMTLSFPNAEFSGLAFFSLLPLLYLLHRENRKISAFSCGLLTGMGFYLGTVYWLTLTMENYGNVPRFLSLFILVIFSVYLACYIGLFAWGVVFLQRSSVPVFLGAPCLWVALEYARGHVMGGFPWALLGYTQYKNLLLIQIADITGVYGISFFIVLVNTIFTFLLICIKEKASLRLLGMPLSALLVSLILFVSYSIYQMNKLNDLPSGEPFKVGVVQANIDQNEKWDPKYRDKILAIHARLSRDVVKDQPELIIWPEASVPFFFMVDKEYQSQLLTLIDDLGTGLLFGSPDYNVENGEPFYYNSVFLISPGGELQGKYDKNHLVPFGEYVPLRKFLFFVNPIIEQIGDMTPGKGISLMNAGRTSCGTPICFEIIFPGLVRQFVLDGAGFIATLTNDNWFGRSSAPAQHFSMAVFRAIENRVPVVRAANSGISGVIYPDGRIVRQTDLFEENAFTEDLPLSSRRPSFYTRFGDIFAQGCILFSAVVMIMTAFNMRKSARADQSEEQAVQVDELRD